MIVVLCSVGTCSTMLTLSPVFPGRRLSVLFIIQCLFYKVFSVEQVNTFSRADVIFPRYVLFHSNKGLKECFQKSIKYYIKKVSCDSMHFWFLNTFPEEFFDS